MFTPNTVMWIRKCRKTLRCEWKMGGISIWGELFHSRSEQDVVSSPCCCSLGDKIIACSFLISVQLFIHSMTLVIGFKSYPTVVTQPPDCST